jgi:homoserine dehydrogenase
VVKLLSQFEDIVVTHIAVRDAIKPREISSEIITTDVDSVVNSPDVDILVEVMGGKDFPYEVIQKALENGKHVVTANKVVIAAHGPELFDLANRNRRSLLFEGAVAGGIPIIVPLKMSLVGNRICQIAGILNGTTNYILTRMEQAGLDFSDALAEAQQKGFAEADPTADIEGHDAASKIGILASIAYKTCVDQSQIHAEGISTIGAEDIEMAKTLGYAIKLIGLAKSSEENAVDVRVHPMLVPLDHPLAKVQFENNAIFVKGDAVGDVMFYGKGAGELPTASAVVGDIVMLARTLQQGQALVAGMQFSASHNVPLLPIAKTTNAYYIRLETEDMSGVIGNLGLACGEHNVSLDAVMQKGTHPETHSATIVLLTHAVQEADMQAALAVIRQQPSTRKVHTVLRVFAS